MTPNEPTIKGLEHLRRIAANALDNDAYCKDLLKDPNSVLEREGVTVPPRVKVVVHQNTATEIHLALPTGLEDASQLNPDETDITKLSRTCVHF